MRKTTSRDLTTELCAVHTGNITGAPGGFQGSRSQPTTLQEGDLPDGGWATQTREHYLAWMMLC